MFIEPKKTTKISKPLPTPVPAMQSKEKVAQPKPAPQPPVQLPDIIKKNEDVSVLLPKPNVQETLIKIPNVTKIAKPKIKKPKKQKSKVEESEKSNLEDEDNEEVEVIKKVDTK